MFFKNIPCNNVNNAQSSTDNEDFKISKIKNYEMPSMYSDEPYHVIRDIISKGVHVIKGKPFSKGDFF